MAEKAVERNTQEEDLNSRESSPEKAPGQFCSRHSVQSLDSLDLVGSDSSEEPLIEETEENGDCSGAPTDANGETKPKRGRRERRISISSDKVSALKVRRASFSLQTYLSSPQWFNIWYVGNITRTALG